jgi:Ribosomal L27 protein
LQRIIAICSSAHSIVEGSTCIVQPSKNAAIFLVSQNIKMSSFISIRKLLRRDVYFGGNCNLWAASIPNSFTVHPSILTNTNNNHTDLICDERRLGGIRGAKKKAGGSSTNGRNSAGRRLGIKVWPNKFASACYL